jgi:hypothetical protein
MVVSISPLFPPERPLTLETATVTPFHLEDQTGQAEAGSHCVLSTFVPDGLCWQTALYPFQLLSIYMSIFNTIDILNNIGYTQITHERRKN